MRRLAFNELSKGGTYLTAAAALKKLHTICDKMGVTDLCYLIAVDPDTGRYYPVALPNASQIQLALSLAHNGVRAIRT